MIIMVVGLLLIIVDRKRAYRVFIALICISLRLT